MSVLKGLAPTVHVTNNDLVNNTRLLSSLVDKDYVRMLLNSYSEDEKKAEAPVVSLNKDFNMTTSSNKSLLVTETVDNGGECTVVDNLKLDCDKSYLINKESFRYKLESPAGGVLAVKDDILEQDPSGMTLNEVNTSSQVISSAQDAFRNNDKKVIKSLLGSDSLGVSDMILANNSVVTVVGDKAIDQGFTFGFDKSNEDPASYSYGTVRVLYEEAKVTVENSPVGNVGNIVLNNGSQVVDVSNQSLALYEGDGYNGGNYSKSSYDDLTSSNVEIVVSNPEGEDACFGRKGRLDNGVKSTNFILQSDFKRADLSELKEAYPRDNLKMSGYQYLEQYPLFNGSESKEFLLRDPLDKNTIEKTNDISKLNTTTDVTIDNRSKSERMNFPSASFVDVTNVFYSQDESSSNSSLVNDNTLLSSDNHDGDVNYKVSLLQPSTVSNGNAQYKDLSQTDVINLVLLDGPHPARNLVFSVNEVTNVELVNELDNGDGFLVNLDDEKRNLDLDENENKDDGGSQVVEGSSISTSFLRQEGIANQANNLRVLFEKRMSSELLKAQRSGVPVAGDSISKIAVSYSTSQSMDSTSTTGKFSLVTNLADGSVEWNPDTTYNEAMQLHTLDANALSFRLGYYPRFHQGGKALKDEINKNGAVDPSGKLVYIPYKVQIDGGSQALTRNSTGALVYTAISPDHPIADIDNVIIQVISSSLDGDVRKVTVEISHHSHIPTLNDKVSYKMTYKYYETGPKAYNWFSSSTNSIYSKGVWPQPSVLLELDSKFVFPHVAKLQLNSESNGWVDLQLQNVNNVNLGLSYTETPLRFSDQSNYDVSLKLYSNYKTRFLQSDGNGGFVSMDEELPLFYNNNYAMNLRTMPGGWSAKYKELTSSNMADIDSLTNSNITGLLADTNPLSVVVSRPQNSLQTTLTVKDGESSLFKCVINNNKVRDVLGYRMLDSLVEAVRVRDINSRLFKDFVQDDSTKKLEDGVWMKFKNTLSSSFSVAVSTNLSIKNDLYMSSWPTILNREVPNDKVLMNYETDLYRWGSNSVYSGNYKRIVALQRRAMKNGVYVFNRPLNKYVSQWGSLLETGNLGTLAANYDSELFYKFTLNFGKSAGIRMGANINSFSNTLTLVDSPPIQLAEHHFRPVFSTVTVKIDGQSVGSHSTFREANPLTLNENAPFVDKYKLNNWYCDEQSVKVKLTQSDIIVQYDSTYQWASSTEMKAAFSADAVRTIKESDFKIQNLQNVNVQELGNLMKGVTLSYVPKLRRSAKVMFASILPEILELQLNNETIYHHLLSRTSLDLKLGESSSNTHVLTFSSINSSKLALSNHTYTVEKNPLLVTLQGSFMENPFTLENGNGNHTYLDEVAFVVDVVNNTKIFKYNVGQYGLNDDERDILHFTFTNAVRNPNTWSNTLTVIPRKLCKITQYVLGFRSEDGLIVPQVCKLKSAAFDPNSILSKKVNGVSIIRVLLEAANIAEVGDLTDVQVDLPYKFSMAPDYPQKPNSMLDLSLQLTQKSVQMTHIDLLVQVNSSDSVSKLNYNNIFGGPAVGKNKVVSIFSKDQLVVVNHLDKLCMRIGPDGRLYTGDVSTYSLYVDSNNLVLDNSANGIVTLPVNNNAVLNNMVQ